MFVATLAICLLIASLGCFILSIAIERVEPAYGLLNASVGLMLAAGILEAVYGV